jgi:hypothetical protein
MPIDEKLRAAAQRNFEQISKSDTFCVLFNEKMVEDVIPLIQMGLAMYLDKPILLLVPRGATVPINLSRIAGGIEEFDPESPESLEVASRRLFAKINQ